MLKTQAGFNQAAYNVERSLISVASKQTDSVLEPCWMWVCERWSDEVVYLIHPPIIRKRDYNAQFRRLELKEEMHHKPNNDCDIGYMKDNDCLDIQRLDESFFSDDSTSEWHLSVVFSEIWSAPVLYFHVNLVDGTSLSREEILRQILEHASPSTLSSHFETHDSIEAQAPYEFLTEEEHPIRGSPSFFLHPCGTQQRLECVKQTTNNKDAAVLLLSWLSLVLPVVGFHLPAECFASAIKQLAVI